LSICVAFQEQAQEVVSLWKIVKVTVADSESMMDFKKVFCSISNIKEVLIENSIMSDVFIARKSILFD
jgi:hypothetical protein